MPTLLCWDTASGKASVSLQPKYSDGVFPERVGTDANGDAIFRPQFRFEVCCLSVSSDGRTFSCGDSGGLVWSWDMGTGKEISAFRAHESTINAMARSPDGKKLATAGNGDLLIRIWEPIKGKQLVGIPVKACIDSLAFTPCARFLASAGRDGLIQLRDLESGKGIRNLQGHKYQVRSLAFSPNGQILISAGTLDFTIRLWETATGKERLRITAHAPKEQENVRLHRGFQIKAGISCIAISPNGQLLASCGWDERVCLWEMATGKEILSVKDHSDSVSGVAFSPDGTKLASCGSDGLVLVWDIGKRIRGKPLADQPLTVAELKEHWSTLSNADPARAYVALETLGAIPKQSVPFVKDQFHRIPTADAKQIAQWIADLNDKNFNTRDKATRELRLLGEVAGPALEKARAKEPTLEVKQRIDQLLALLEPGKMAPERLRLLRTIQVLEKIGNAEARALLERFAEGNPRDPLTQDAVATLARLKQRALSK
jgi:WD40 repeat protein